MSGAVSAHAGNGTSGPKGSFAPFIHCPATGSPFSFIGVWQSAQPAIPVTRYLPRRISAEPVALTGRLADCAEVIAAQYKQPTAIAKILTPYVSLVVVPPPVSVEPILGSVAKQLVVLEIGLYEARLKLEFPC